jgi:hypothetical protein
MRKLFNSLLLSLTILFSANLFAAETVKVSGISNTFSSGELSPMLDGRTDIQAYYNGVKEAENFIVLPFGGLTRRPGTYYVAAVKNSSAAAHLIPFQFSTEQAYIIEAGDKYMRFYMDNGYINDTNSTIPYEINTTYTKDEVFDLQYAQDADTMWIVHPNHKPAKLTRTGHTAWNLTDYTPTGSPFGGYGTFTKLMLHCDGADTNTTFIDEAGKTITAVGDAQIDTAWKKFGTGSALLDGTGDYLSVPASTDFAFGTGDFTVEEVINLTSTAAQEFIGNGYLSGWDLEYNGANKLYFYIAGGGDSWTWTPTTNTTYHVAVTRNGGNLRAFINGVNLGTKTGHTEDITGANNLYVGNDFTSNYPISGHIDEVRISKGIARWTANFTVPTEAYAEIDYPSCVAFYEQRLAFAGTSTYPQTIWMTASGDYENMTVGSNDNDALEFELVSEQVNAIRWLSPGKVLLAGTSGGIFSISSGSDSEPITPTNILAKREATYGSAMVMPKRIGNLVYYLQRNGKILREIGYSYDLDEYQTNDMTILSEHVTDSGIVDMDYQQSPYNILWCVRSDGEMATFTRQVEQKVVAWSRQVTDGKYESVAVIPGNNTDDQVWFVVNRTINGTVIKDVEYLMPFFNYTNQTRAFFVDCGLSLYNGTNATIVSGLNHLENMTVSVLGDGVVLDNETVSNGNITLSSPAATVHVGLSYPYKLQTMRLDANTALGTAQGKIKRINKVQVRLYNSYGGELGNEDKQDAIAYDNTTFYTGDKELTFPSKYDKNAYVVLKGDKPTPMTVLAIMPDFTISDY